LIVANLFNSRNQKKIKYFATLKKLVHCGKVQNNVTVIAILLYLYCKSFVDSWLDFI